MAGVPHRSRAASSSLQGPWLEERAADSFEWTYLEAGPSQWRVQIAKRDGGFGRDADESRCPGGGCGG
ncbi:hypothetical protein WT08_20835 [Burkholderia sp. MSMB1552]|nr:hypothetical protein WT08_20835 [Burkholderia sp. MSMB1552]